MKTELKSTAEEAYFTALKHGARYPEGEPTLARDPYWAYEYARDVGR